MVLRSVQQKYPGEITNVLNKEVVVTTMHPAGNIWLNQKDECIYLFSAVIVKINTLKVNDKRGEFHMIIPFDCCTCIEICTHMFCSNYFVLIDLTLDIKMFLTY